MRSVTPTKMPSLASPSFVTARVEGAVLAALVAAAMSTKAPVRLDEGSCEPDALLRAYEGAVDADGEEAGASGEAAREPDEGPAGPANGAAAVAPAWPAWVPGAVRANGLRGGGAPGGGVGSLATLTSVRGAHGRWAAGIGGGQRG